jgi:hypothetical protein
MAMKDYNSSNFRNTVIDRLTGKFGKGDGPGDKLKKEGQKMKAEGQKMKAEGQAMKKLGKQSISPAKGMYDELDTRTKASQIKMRETASLAPIKGTELSPKNRTAAEQRILDKDMAIIRAKEAAAKIKAQKEAAVLAADKKKAADMRKKGGYSKKGF